MQDTRSKNNQNARSARDVLVTILPISPTLNRESALKPVVPSDQVFQIVSSLDKKQNLNSVILTSSWPILKSAISSLSTNNRVRLFKSVGREARQRLVPLLTSDEYKKVVRLLNLHKNSIAYHLEPASTTLVAYLHWTILDFRKEYSKRKDRLSSHGPVWVVDESNKLQGCMDLSQASVLDDSESIKDWLNECEPDDVAFLDDRQKQWLEKVRSLPKSELNYCIPVSDFDGFFMGAVCDREVLRIADEESARSAAIQSGVVPANTPYIKSPFWLLISKRLFWLLVLVAIEVGAGSVISAFNTTLEAQIVLSFFLPLTIAVGGNAGTQAAVVLIQAFAEGSLRMSWMDFWKALGIETVVGSADGLIIGCVMFGVAWWKGGQMIAITVLVSLFTVVVFADLIGLLLPFAFKYFKIDPAVATSSIITAVLDVVGLAIFFGYAVKILHL
mmetsp:Transcript_24176/g.39718  ORF Transcript_24176/g.39718 Transcript_24176/m.39718 type:complete len:445 (+) Transcript_24176:211-1545(+)|eukprot:CAMPEP_0184662488 /NCGR_PEP_ID=MMETSP0308-20130426/43528_1 /TAXON_ID=38269 /ORGANISM="Gloeochaete witrockiana, Strain SAG 46.84" /LENGTH=444 /DNA_ID=CAMNT_0027104547 /DNA_START=204 /DNA_END=1538 /DNA_ORIENTATION=+